MAQKKPKILVVGAPNEYHTCYMYEVLKRRGAEPILIDTLNFPEKITLSLRNSRIFYNGAPLDDIKGCYIRSVLYSLPPYDLEDKRDAAGKLETDNWYRDYRAERERQALLGSIFRILSFQDIPIVNPIASFNLHYVKPLQIELLRKEGVKVPETLVTNNPKELIEFRKQFKHVVFKPVAGGAQCRELTDEDLSPERLQRLQNAPVLFQELIPGKNVRVYAIKDRILVAGIIESETVDYRQHEEGYVKIDLPSDVAQMCLKAMHLCDYRFTGMDLRMKPDGEFVVIECNPSAMFMGFEKSLKVDLAGPLADYLLGRL